MKYARLFSVSAALVASLVLSMPIFAGSTRANVPFEFEVAGKVLPAGEYRFVCPTGSAMMQIIGAKGETTLTPVKEAGQSLQKVQVRFDKTGDAKKLASVVVLGKTGYRTVSIR
jgi:hypothetical protein